MGYVATVGSFKRALTENVSILELYFARTTSTTFETVYQKKLNFSRGAYIVICLQIRNTNAGSITTCEFEMDGSTIWTLTHNATNFDDRYFHSALTSAQKVYGDFIIKLKCNANTAEIKNVNIYLSDA